jgi:hypothetical protein
MILELRVNQLCPKMTTQTCGAGDGSLFYRGYENGLSGDLKNVFLMQEVFCENGDDYGAFWVLHLRIP